MIDLVQTATANTSPVSGVMQFSVMEILGAIATVLGIVATVQVIGNRSIAKTMDAKLGAPMARSEEKLTALTDSVDEHKRATNSQYQQQSLALSQISTEFGDMKGRVSVVEDRTAFMMRSGPYKKLGDNQ